MSRGYWSERDITELDAAEYITFTPATAGSVYLLRNLLRRC